VIAMMWNEGYGGDWWVMGVFMLLFVVLIVGGGAWLLNRAGKPPSSPAVTGSTARRILDERFARGEISEDEYRQRRNLLQPR
jgi:putative membrane protein